VQSSVRKGRQRILRSSFAADLVEQNVEFAD
jgi:hypothetical protein